MDLKDINQDPDPPKWRELVCELVLPVRSMNSVAKARARSVRGSTVESVRVPNDIVNMLLQSDAHRIYQISDVLPRKDEIRGHVLQGIATDKVGRIDRYCAHPRFVIHRSNQDMGLVVENRSVSLDGLGCE